MVAAPLTLSWECRDEEHRACSGRTALNEMCECECHQDPSLVRSRALPSTRPPEKVLEPV